MVHSRRKNLSSYTNFSSKSKIRCSRALRIGSLNPIWIRYLSSDMNRSLRNQRFPLLAKGPEAQILSNKSSFLPSKCSGKERDLIFTNLSLQIVAKISLSSSNIVSRWQTLKKVSLSSIQKINLSNFSPKCPLKILISKARSSPVFE